MFRNRITSISQILDVIKEYEKGATVEYLIDRFNGSGTDMSGNVVYLANW